MPGQSGRENVSRSDGLDMYCPLGTQCDGTNMFPALRRSQSMRGDRYEFPNVKSCQILISAVEMIKQGYEIEVLEQRTRRLS